MSKYYYSPSSIYFTEDQVLYIINSVLPLEHGEWPPDPAEVDSNARGTTAWLVIVGDTMAEFDLRLKRTKKDGEQLIKQVQDDIPIKLLDIGARYALWYICGSRRKIDNYNTWMRKRLYKRRLRLSRNSQLVSKTTRA